MEQVFTFAHDMGSGILRKSECYTIMPVRLQLFNPFVC